MKNFIIIVFLVLLISTGLYFFYSKDNLIKENVINSVISTKDNYIEKRLGNMLLKLPESSKSITEKKDFLNLSIKSGEDFTIKVYLLLNSNKGAMNITDWFKENNPEFGKQSPYRILEEKELLIDGIYSHKVRYENDPQLTGGYYDLITIYIPYNTDIYQIEYYSVPEGEVEPSLALNEQEKKEAEEYEKIVQEILQSIRFVE